MTLATADLDAILAALDAAEGLADFAGDNPLDYIAWTPPQRALLACEESRVLLRTGNQFGKTWAGLAECIYRCLGAHPLKPVRAAPIEAWIITTSWSQSLAIQQKLWTLLPKGAVVEGTQFDPVRGFRGGVTPVVEFANGSIIRIKTSGQGGLNLASATIHFVLADEPLPSSRIYQEVERRLMRTGGTIAMTMTPVNAPVEWVRAMVDEGKVQDLHFRMEPANFIPVGESEPLTIEDDSGGLVPMGADWIAAQRASVLSWEAPVVLDGEWEFRAVDRVFENFREDVHVIPNLIRSDVMPRNVEYLTSFGLDYGEDRLRTCGVVVYVDATGRYPKLYIAAEYAPDTSTTEDMDAQGVLGAVARAGLTWKALDYAFGDKRYTDAGGRITKKSNKSMLVALEHELGVNGLRPRIRGAKRGAGAGRGAPRLGVRWLNSAMIRPHHFYIDSSCGWLIECLNKWDGTARSDYKDAVDALRYACKPWILRRRSSGPVATLQFRGRPS